MAESQHKRVAVVGAAGFVGREVLRQLEEAGVAATAVIRGSPEMTLDGAFHRALAPADAATVDPFDVVLNLAYPAGGLPWDDEKRNAELAHMVGTLTRSGGRVIQASTLAVFGFTLSRPISASAVRQVRDDAYIESKIAAERLFAELQERRGLALDIVRFGNIWGYASGAWALPIVQRLVTGRPVGVKGSRHHSNVTDVANAASYLTHLINQDVPAAGIDYHHVAEFSGVSWIDWIAPIADALNVEPVYAERTALVVPAGLDEVRGLAEPLGPRAIYRKLAVERTSGSVTRSFIRRLPASAREKLRSSDLIFAPAPVYSRAEQVFLSIIAAEREFRSDNLGQWTPRLGQAESLESVLSWLGDS